MLLLALAHHEGVQAATASRGRVQHGRRHRVGAQGQPAHGVVVQVRGEVEHDPPDQRCGLGVEGDPAQVDVVVSLTARGQHDPAAHHRLGEHLRQQQTAVVGRPGVARAGRCGAHAQRL